MNLVALEDRIAAAYASALAAKRRGYDAEAARQMRLFADLHAQRAPRVVREMEERMGLR